MYNVRLHVTDSEGKTVPMDPVTKDKNIYLTGSNKNVPSSNKTVADVINSLGTLAFASDIQIPVASTESAGVVTLSNEIADTEDDKTAATVKAVSLVNKASLHKEGDEDVSGEKNFVDGVIVQGHLRITTTTNEETGDVTVKFAQIV